MFINISYYILYITSTSKQLSSPSGTPHDAHGALRVAGEGFRRQASKQSGPVPSTSSYLSRSLSTNLVYNIYIYYLSIYIHRYITYYIRYGILRMVKISRYPSGRCFLFSTFCVIKQWSLVKRSPYRKNCLYSPMMNMMKSQCIEGMILNLDKHMSHMSFPHYIILHSNYLLVIKPL